MTSARVTICNKKGLHARAAAKLVKTAVSYDAKIEVIRLPRGDELPDENAKAGATSILSLLMLAAEKGVEIELNAQGADAEQAVAAIVALVERRFDEEE
ncbi:MAG: HPr family phosphocarrier protein [Pseudomonadota bacterium]